jgi:hypothetical protein
MVMAPAVLYRIDADDRIVEVGGSWQTFAEENGGIGEVVGSQLWDFVSGDDVRAVWTLLLRRARVGGDRLRFRYRCDAPGVRRLMQMELVPQEDGGVAFESRELDASAKAPLPGRRDDGTSGTVTVCGWCGRVRADTWVSPEAAIGLLGLAGEAARLSHGVCGDCAAELRGLAQA